MQEVKGICVTLPKKPYYVTQSHNVTQEWKNQKGMVLYCNQIKTLALPKKTKSLTKCAAAAIPDVTRHAHWYNRRYKSSKIIKGKI